MTDGNGVFTTGVASTLAQTETVTAVSGPTSLAATVQFIAGPASAVTSSLSCSPGSQVADNSNVVVASLILRDAQNNPISGVNPSFSASGVSTSLTAAAVTSALGQSSANYRTAVAQNENAMVTAGGIRLTCSLLFVAGPASTGASTMFASPSSVAGDGVAMISLTTTARDAQGYDERRAS